MTAEQKHAAFVRVVERVRAITPKTWCDADSVAHVQDDLRTNARWYASLERQRDQAKASLQGLNAGGCFQSKPFSILR